jgi:hypothetical protein
MRKRWLYLIILVLLVALALGLFLKNRQVNTLDEDSDYAVADTGIITKIFLADKKNNTVLLKKDSIGKWTVNDKYAASDYSIRLFLKTLMSIDVKSPVSKEAQANMVKIMAGNSVKVEIYQKAFRVDLFDYIRWFPYERLAKTYYVGFATQDNTGTYMLMEGSSTPYIVHIPGFKGFLSTRYSVLEKDWRDHTIYNYHYKDLASVSIWMPEYPGQSFKAKKKGLRDFELHRLLDYNKESPERIIGYDTLELMDLFSSFEDVRYETLIDEMTKEKQDSILKAVPFHVITLETVSGEINTLKTWHKKGGNTVLDTTMQPSLWDPDRLYALINNGSDFTLIQFFVFDRILRPLNSLMKKNAEMPAKTVN